MKAAHGGGGGPAAPLGPGRARGARGGGRGVPRGRPGPVSGQRGWPPPHQRGRPSRASKGFGTPPHGVAKAAGIPLRHQRGRGPRPATTSDPALRPLDEAANQGLARERLFLPANGRAGRRRGSSRTANQQAEGTHPARRRGGSAGRREV